MRIRYITRSAGPEGCFQPGQVRDLPDAEARALMAAGAAVPMDVAYQTATVEPREERAIAVEPQPEKQRTVRRRRKPR